jgi:hypothetical protein
MKAIGYGDILSKGLLGFISVGIDHGGIAGRARIDNDRANGFTVRRGVGVVVLKSKPISPIYSGSPFSSKKT